MPFYNRPHFQRADDPAQNTSTFTPAPRNPIWQYIAADLLHRPRPATLVITLEQFKNKPPDLQIGERDSLFVEQNLQIDKHPAIAVDYETRGMDRSFRHMDLYVSISEGSLWDKVCGYSDLHNADQLSAEMTAILDSFYIERVPAQTDDSP